MRQEALASYGYMRTQAKTFTDRYSIGPVSVFGVDSGFPRIRPDDVPAGVEEVRFAIPIGAIARFAMPADRVVGPPIAALEASE